MRAVKAYARDGCLPLTVLDRADRRETDDRLPAIAAAIKGADPDLTLQAISTRLKAMRERTPRGRRSWGYCVGDSKVRSSLEGSTGRSTTTCSKRELCLIW